MYSNRNHGRLDSAMRDLYKTSRNTTDYNQRLIAHVSPYQLKNEDATAHSSYVDLGGQFYHHSYPSSLRRENLQQPRVQKVDHHDRRDIRGTVLKEEDPDDCHQNSDTESDSPEWAADLLSVERRDAAIIELCKNSDVIDNIGKLLWNSPGCMAILLGELVKLYPLIHPPSLPGNAVARVCSITALFQRVVLEQETKKNFLEAKIIMYLLPFLAIEGSTREAEHLRVCTLSLLCTMAGLLTVSELEEYLDLRQSEVFPLTITTLKGCISEVGRTMATILLGLLLRDDFIVELISNRRAVFIDIVLALNSSLNYISKRSHAPTRAKRLLNFIVICLQRLASHDRLRQALAHSLPAPLRDNRLIVVFQGDQEVYQWLFQLKEKLLMSPMSSYSIPQSSDALGSGVYSRLAAGDSFVSPLKPLERNSILNQ